jgi:hypothetical protein
VKLYTAETMARDAARQFKELYFRNGKWVDGTYFYWVKPGETTQSTYERLLALGPTPTPEAVRELTNDSWVTPGRCHECKQDSAVLVEVGEEPDYESSTARLCPKCISEALRQLFRAGEK